METDKKNNIYGETKDGKSFKIGEPTNFKVKGSGECDSLEKLLHEQGLYPYGYFYTVVGYAVKVIGRTVKITAFARKIPYDNTYDEILVEAKARCGEDDKFNLKTGFDIAYKRLERYCKKNNIVMEIERTKKVNL